MALLLSNQPAGPVARVFIAKHKETNQSRGFAFVTFHYRQDAELAMQKLDVSTYIHSRDCDDGLRYCFSL